MYDVTRLETLDSLHQEWLPLIRDILVASDEEKISNGNKPNHRVIVVGTKTDLLGESMIEDIRRSDEKERLSALFHEFDPMVKFCDRCSAKLLHVDNVFYHGELVVAFPIEPLYNKKLSTYTSEGIKALKRIFRIVDVDKDALLSNDELNQLEILCFNHTFRDQEIEMIKRHLHHNVHNSFEDGKLTIDGFFGFMYLFIDRSLPQIPWAVLERYGYDDEITLRNLPKSLHDCTSNDLKVQRRQCFVELSPAASSFLFSLMNFASKKSLGELNMKDELSSSIIDEVFSVLPEKQRMFWGSKYINMDVNELYLLFGLQRKHGEENVSKSGEESRTIILRLIEPISCHAFLSQIQVLATICPYNVKLLLYQLGFAEQSDLGLIYRSTHNECFQKNSEHYPRRLLHVAVICTTSWRIVDLINGRIPFDMHTLTSSGCTNFINGEFYYFVFTEISIGTAKTVDGIYSSYDIVLVQFDSSIFNALKILKALDQHLPPLPRLFVTTNRSNAEYKEEAKNNRVDMEFGEQTKSCLLDNIDIEYANEALDKICMQIARLIVDPTQGVPLASRTSHTSTRNYGLILIMSMVGAMGMFFCLSRLREMKLSIKGCLRSFECK